MLRFYGLRVLKDYLGHIILLGLPIVLITLMVVINREAAPDSVEEAALFIGLAYILMFHGFGAAYTFEGIEHDFFSAFKDRLRASPVNPMRFVLANLSFSIVTSFLQTLVLVVFIVLAFEVRIAQWPLVLGVLLMSVVFIQLFAAVLILCMKKTAKAQALMIAYIILSMFAAGLFFPLPQTAITEFLAKYSSPLAWTHRALYGVMESSLAQALIGVGLLSAAILFVAAIAYRLSRRVAT